MSLSKYVARQQYLKLRIIFRKKKKKKQEEVKEEDTASQKGRSVGFDVKSLFYYYYFISRELSKNLVKLQDVVPEERKILLEEEWSGYAVIASNHIVLKEQAVWIQNIFLLKQNFVCELLFGCSQSPNFHLT